MSPAPQRTAQPSAAALTAMAGAIDLGAVKARSDAAARAAALPPRPVSASVIDITEETFQTEVLDRSFQVPVLLDLWATWCEPCKQLSPILERLAEEAAGAWILAKIDVDANPRISQALQVQSIPTVFAVLGGQLVPGFQGALPEAQVREFVTAVLDAGAQAGLTGALPVGDGEVEPAEAPADPRFVAAEDLLEAGDFAGSAAAYQAILASEPANIEADLALRQVRLLERTVGLEPDSVAQSDARPDDVAAALAAADYELTGNDVEAAFSRLLKLLRRTSGEDRDQVRDRLVEYFELLGPDDPRVGPARRDLTNALF
jgi:putative thioredoxin